jgi:DNA invertase Pin-like site-specific DNA recombinase
MAKSKQDSTKGNPQMGKAFIYLRVSTEEQSLSPEWQKQVCMAYFENHLRARGFELGGIYEDIGQSAYKIPWAEREAGRELFRAVTPGSVIIVAKQDRAWRSVRDRENTMFYCQQIGIHLAILDAQLDTSTAAGKFAAGVIALQSAWESDVRSERMKAALTVRKKRRAPSKANPPPGWKYDRVNGELVPDTRERKLLELIYSWRAQRVRSIESTCRWLNQREIQRDSGAKYNVQWVQRAWLARQKGWPPEGYVQSFWRDPSVPASEKDKYRLPRIGGKQYVNFHPRRVRRVDEKDVRWLASAYPNLTCVSGP